MKILFWIVGVVLLVAGCAQEEGVSPKKEPKTNTEIVKSDLKLLEDGVYLLLSELNDTSNFSGNGRVVEYSHDFLDEDGAGDSLFFVVDPNDFVPLNLAQEPEGVKQEDDRIHLLLKLNSIASDQFEEFTGKHLNERVAIIIGGKAYTKHIIRTKVIGGNLQISRCTDNACEHLLLELQNNY